MIFAVNWSAETNAKPPWSSWIVFISCGNWSHKDSNVLLHADVPLVCKSSQTGLFALAMFSLTHTETSPLRYSCSNPFVLFPHSFLHFFGFTPPGGEKKPSIRAAVIFMAPAFALISGFHCTCCYWGSTKLCQLEEEDVSSPDSQAQLPVCRFCWDD